MISRFAADFLHSPRLLIDYADFFEY